MRRTVIHHITVSSACSCSSKALFIFMLYNEYMQSADWRSKRRQRLEMDGHKCRLCDHDGSKWRLEVHHRPSCYAKIPNESPVDDLVTLCARCHHFVTTSIRKDRAVAKKPRGYFQVNWRMWQVAALLTVMILFLIYVTR